MGYRMGYRLDYRRALVGYRMVCEVVSPAHPKPDPPRIVWKLTGLRFLGLWELLLPEARTHLTPAPLDPARPDLARRSPAPARPDPDPTRPPTYTKAGPPLARPETTGPQPGPNPGPSDPHPAFL